MLEKLKELALRRDDLEAQLADPAVYGDSDRLRTIQRELKELTPVTDTWQAWKEAGKRLSEAEALIHDPDLKELAQEELAAARSAREELEERLRLLLLPKDGT